jgi:hypothetical protein
MKTIAALACLILVTSASAQMPTGSREVQATEIHAEPTFIAPIDAARPVLQAIGHENRADEEASLWQGSTAMKIALGVLSASLLVTLVLLVRRRPVTAQAEAVEARRTATPLLDDPMGFGDRLARRVNAEFYAMLFDALEQGLAERGYMLSTSGEGDTSTTYPSVHDMIYVGRVVELVRTKELRPYLSEREIKLKVDLEKEDGYSQAFANCLLSAALLEGRHLSRMGYPMPRNADRTFSDFTTEDVIAAVSEAIGDTAFLEKKLH